MLPASFSGLRAPLCSIFSLSCLSTPPPRPLGHHEPPLLHLPPHLQPLPLTSSPSPIRHQSDQASPWNPAKISAQARPSLSSPPVDRVAVGKEVGFQWEHQGPEHDRCERGTGATPVSILQGAPDGCGGLVGSASHSGARQSSEGHTLGQTGLRPPACSEIALLSLLERRPQPGEDRSSATPAES